ncbi:glutamate:Na+ symporter, ESS family [Acetomicrobium thermoterrenum DSM 13490]|jgi:ESS family glutamate:Na+ symporter|uniref:Sodium/glutamate symporter n=2 Tax=Acetomicrobium TaxID=49894 RepID=A0A0T5X8Z1_9BACT|nr:MULTISPECIES: sodium/glutamate symporter [Acetomicrobium]KRT34771.1 sodium/glutamate symporter [Acetomicrobium hydrogeniformans ATCC BAA-1850]SDX84935.1 glutamate:Na+ symporter, ESS family [Acetomicrobium thermoterrenum DSM 13490]
MSWGLINGIFTINLDGMWTTALAAVLLLVGYGLRRRIGILEHFCIPAPVIGGVLMSLLVLFLHHRGGSSIKFNTALQSPLMIAFFTTVGIGGSFGLLKRGGKALIIYLVFCWGMALFQNGFGVGLAKLLGIHPVLGVMAGAVSLEGGHGGAAAFGPVAESLGVSGAQVVAIASATYGLIAGGLLGGPVARWLIDRYKVTISPNDDVVYMQHLQEGKEEKREGFASFDFIKMLALVLVIMALGSFVTGKVKELYNFSLPGYVAAMFVAVVFRNINDHVGFVKLHDKAIELISDVSLGIFLTMAMMSLRIWELYDLAVPLIVILVMQTVAILLIAAFLLFRILGKDYDAAVMCAGFVGHGMGATPNAVANMSAVCEHYNVMSYKAFLIIPLCGAVLIDLVGIPSIVWFINYFAN